MPFNRVYNGGFEIPDGTGAFPDGWVKGAGDANTVWTWTTENAYDGSRAIKIANPTFTANLTSLIQDATAAVAVTPGERWEASAWMLADAPGKQLRLLVDSYDGAGAFVHSAHLKFTSAAAPARFAGVVLPAPRIPWRQRDKPRGRSRRWRASTAMPSTPPSRRTHPSGRPSPGSGWF